MKISPIDVSETIDGKSLINQISTIQCNVTIKPTAGDEIRFLFEWNGPIFKTVSDKLPFIPTRKKPLPDLQSFFTGVCYNITSNGHKIPLRGYSFQLSSDLSYGTFVLGKRNFYYYLQIVNKHWIVVSPVCTDDSNAKTFFFSNSVSHYEFKDAANKGPIYEEIQNVTGKIPSEDDIYNFVVNEVGNP